MSGAGAAVSAIEKAASVTNLIIDELGIQTSCAVKPPILTPLLTPGSVKHSQIFL
jgi:hypothetical protein